MTPPLVLSRWQPTFPMEVFHLVVGENIYWNLVGSQPGVTDPLLSFNSAFTTLPLQSPFQIPLVSGSFLSESHVLSPPPRPLALVRVSFAWSAVHGTKLTMETKSLTRGLVLNYTSYKVFARVISGSGALVQAHRELILKLSSFSKNRFPAGTLNNVLRITDGNEARRESWLPDMNSHFNLIYQFGLKKERRIHLTAVLSCDLIRIVHI